jgi:hypothetical protein
MSTRDRFYWRTIGYHLWGIFERHDDNMPIVARPDSALDRLVESKGAALADDDLAKDYVRHRTFALNQREGHAQAAALPLIPESAGISVDNKTGEE